MLFVTGFPTDIGIVLWQLLPFSRGNVTIVVSGFFFLIDLDDLRLIDWIWIDLIYRF